MWYTIDVYTPPKDQQTPKCQFDPATGFNTCVYPHVIQKLGVYGHCDVYVTGSNGNYNVDHHCTAADAAGLKPPQNTTNMTAGTNTTEVCLSCGGSNITSSNSSSSAKMNLVEGIKALQSGDRVGAMTHLNAALKCCKTSNDKRFTRGSEEGLKALAGGDINGAITEFKWNNTIP